jgi:5-methylcytosine-specific restriction endonuclease McrA
MSKGWKTYDTPKDWEETRLRILRRDHWRCVLCGNKGNQVDHIIPVSQGGLNTDDNLRVLCYDCHKKKSAQEGNAARKEKYGKREREAHPGYRDL